MSYASSNKGSVKSYSKKDAAAPRGGSGLSAGVASGLSFVKPCADLDPAQVTTGKVEMPVVDTSGTGTSRKGKSFKWK